MRPALHDDLGCHRNEIGLVLHRGSTDRLRFQFTRVRSHSLYRVKGGFLVVIFELIFDAWSGVHSPGPVPRLPIGVEIQVELFLDRTLCYVDVDELDVVRFGRAESWDMCLRFKRLFREEGLMVGPSTGAIVHAVLEFGRDNEGLAVGISPDNGFKYTSYFADILGDEGKPKV